MGPTRTRPGRRAAVVGSPVDHSLSPVLHRAAYRELGLSDWSYERRDCPSGALAALVAELGPEWAGLSVTMPGKREALELAAEVTPRAAAVGAANTLVPRAGDGGGWRADCTDVDGVVGALRSAGGYAGGAAGVVLGAGGTAAAVLAAFAELGLARATVLVRDPSRAGAARAAARRCGLGVTVARLDAAGVAEYATRADVLVSTIPAEAAAPHAALLATAGSVLDVIYHPWPTPLAEAALTGGRPVATGLDMLLHQSFGQVEQFTGLPAPREAMRDALRAATGGALPLPLGAG